VRYNEPLSRHTTLRIGGLAAAYVKAESLADLKALLGYCREQHDPKSAIPLAPAVAQPHEAKNLPWKVIGAGSNLLVSDQGWPGVIIRLGKGFTQLENEGTILRIGAANALDDAVEHACSAGLSGVEFLSGIPGTLGGALRTNAGAFEHEFSELFVSAEGIDGHGQERTFSRKELKFSYRKSSLPDDVIITGAVLKLQPGRTQEIERRLAQIKHRRQTSQPHGATAGCVFKNPKNEVAGRLIDRCGLKGRRIGDAIISDRHANFIINLGKARCSDVYQLIEVIKLKVEEKFGLVLEEEIEIVGALAE
jgi:UDP-N-acetylmuramate dehydrogenase